MRRTEDQELSFLQASNEVDSHGPRGFFQPVVGGWHTLKDYPTLITTQMSGDRARRALTYLSVSPLCFTSHVHCTGFCIILFDTWGCSSLCECTVCL